MGIDFAVVSAVFRKDMRQYLGNPTGYVFLTLFIATTAAAAFLQDGFFARNLADLAELNSVMPAILMFFVPAITMSAWADERRGGTDELLLTMPVRDAEVVVGKYLGVLGMYAISLAFSLSNVAVLLSLGEPDMGLMAATYFGYLLMGALFCAVGLVASMLTPNSTVAFILGALGCAGLVFAGTQPWASGVLGAAVIGSIVALITYVFTTKPSMAGIGGLLGGVLGVVIWLVSASGAEPTTDTPAVTATEDGKADAKAEDGKADAKAEDGKAEGKAGDKGEDDKSSDDDSTEEVTADALRGDNDFVQAFDALSVTQHFASFGEGVLRLGDIFYFLAGIASLLYLATFLLGRRHW